MTTIKIEAVSNQISSRLASYIRNRCTYHHKINWGEKQLVTDKYWRKQNPRGGYFYEHKINEYWVWLGHDSRLGFRRVIHLNNTLYAVRHIVDDSKLSLSQKLDSLDVLIGKAIHD